MNGVEFGFYTPDISFNKKDFYRAIAWNVERGIQYEGILEILKSHAELSQSDLFFLTETDIGMARSGNRNIARELAIDLGMNYCFAPSYLNLCEGNDKMGFYGNALLSRYPIENIRTIPLKNSKDKMQRKEKRMGNQKALLADVLFPYKKMTVVVAQLDAHSSQRQRAAQMKSILKGLKKNPYPILLGGDLNTNSYNTHHAFFAFCGFWNKVVRGMDDVIDNHYSSPDKYYDRFLFRVFKKFGFSYEPFNELGVGTLHTLIQEVVPKWGRHLMEETLRRHGGQVSLKLDWFAARGLKLATHPEASPPKVIPGLRVRNRRLSDHDPILVDLTF